MRPTVRNLAKVFFFMLAPGLASAAPVAVDLNTWTAESYPAVSGFPDGVWTVATGGSSVRQSANGQPTIFYSDFNAFGTEITGKIQVESGAGDDDFIGFVLGFNPGDSSNASADYLLIDWKRGTQSFNFGSPSASPGGSAPLGLALSRVTGIPDADELWQHANLEGTPTSSGVEELARGLTLGDTGWAFGTDYEFRFDFGPNNLRAFVDNALQFDITGTFSNGRVGFYNFSQQQVVYSAFELDQGSFPPENGNGNGDGNGSIPVPAPGTLVLFGLGLVGLGIVRRRKA